MYFFWNPVLWFWFYLFDGLQTVNLVGSTYVAVSSAYVTCAEILLNEDSVNHNPDHSQQATVLSSLWNVLLLKLLLLRKWSQGLPDMGAKLPFFWGGGPRWPKALTLAWCCQRIVKVSGKAGQKFWGLIWRKFVKLVALWRKIGKILIVFVTRHN